jgi:hypothetical protein
MSGYRGGWGQEESTEVNGSPRFRMLLHLRRGSDARARVRLSSVQYSLVVSSEYSSTVWYGMVWCPSYPPSVCSVTEGGGVMQR